MPPRYLERRGRVLCGALALLWLSAARDAYAYRPFDGTDADVAEVGEFEIELGPVEYYQRSREAYLLAPATVLNLGVAPKIEAVLDFSQLIQASAHRSCLCGSDAMLKWLLREGSLQGGHGVSLAIEAGPLLPELRGEHRFGAALDLISSYHARAGSVHLNETAALSRAGNLAFSSSLILEAPSELTLRPVAELSFAREYREGSSYSALLGAIWPAATSINVDGAVRVAREGRENALELRFGFTWAETVWALR